MKEIFIINIKEFIKSKQEEIIKKINNEDLNFILENNDEYVSNLINQFKTTPIHVNYDKIEYSEKKKKGFYMDGTPVEQKIYTFKVPFEGNNDLLNYRSNKGKYKPRTYYIKDEFIYFTSLNFDLKPISKKFSNTIDILKSIITHLNKDYENWNNTVQKYIEFNVTYRKNILKSFKKFCDEYNLSEEEIGKMEFKLSALEALSHIIAEIYTGSEITTLFKKSGFPEIVHDGNTKWKFLCETFEKMQKESIEGFYKILKVLEVVCDPQEYLSNPELYENVLEKVNRVLGFYGFEFNHEGMLTKLEKNNTKLKSYSLKKINNEEHYDVFISHSSTDKTWVNELYGCLSKTDLKIWYDNSIIKIGDNIRDKINQGLTKSDYGIVVLSKDFIERSWPKMEFDALLPLIDEGKLLPINHGLTNEELSEFFSPLLSIQHMSTEKYAIKEICEEILSKIND